MSLLLDTLIPSIHRVVVIAFHFSIFVSLSSILRHFLRAAPPGRWLQPPHAPQRLLISSDSNSVISARSGCYFVFIGERNSLRRYPVPIYFPTRTDNSYELIVIDQTNIGFFGLNPTALPTHSPQPYSKWN